MRVDPLAMPALMAKLRANPPVTLAGVAVTAVQDVVAADLLRFFCGDVARVQIRPSGTEPKVKVYVETVGADPTPFLDAMEAAHDLSARSDGGARPDADCCSSTYQRPNWRSPASPRPGTM